MKQSLCSGSLQMWGVLRCGKPSASQAVHGLPTEPARASHPRLFISYCHQPERLSQDSASPSRALFPPNIFIQWRPIPAVLQVYFLTVGKVELHLGVSTAHRGVPHSHQCLQTLTPSSHSNREFSRWDQCTVRLCPCWHSTSSVHSTGNANKDGWNKDVF